MNPAAARRDEREIDQDRVDPLHLGLGALDRELRRLALRFGGAKRRRRRVGLGDALIEHLPGHVSLFDQRLAPFHLRLGKNLIGFALGDQRLRFGQGLLGLEHLCPGAAKLRFVFGRRYAADHLSGRDLVTFLDRHAREPAGIFGRHIDLGCLDASVRFHDALGHRCAAQLVYQRPQLRLRMRRR